MTICPIYQSQIPLQISDLMLATSWRSSWSWGYCSHLRRGWSSEGKGEGLFQQMTAVVSAEINQLHAAPSWSSLGSTQSRPISPWACAVRFLR